MQLSGMDYYAAHPKDVVTDLLNGSDSLRDCASRQVEISLFDTVSLAPALMIIFVLSMNKQRKTYNPDCCRGRPGVVVPLNLLDEFEHRFSYAAAFGGITNTIFGILTGFDGVGIVAKTSASVKVLLSFWRSFQVCINFYPFFACLYTENVLLGAAMGAAYSALWVALKIFSMVGCANPVPEVVPYLTVMSQTPTVLCLVFLVMKFVSCAILYLRGKSKGSRLQKIEGSVVFPFQIQYVRSLLRKPPPEVDWHSKELSIWKKLKAYSKRDFYDSRCHFKFSTRILCTLMIIFMASYQMGIFHIYFSEVAKQGLAELAVTLVNTSRLIPSNSTRTVSQNIEAALSLLKGSWNVSTGLAYIISNLGLLGTLSNYRTNQLSLYRGDRTFCPKGYSVNAATYVSNSMKYSGYQIAFAIWGNLILVLVLLVVALLVSFVIILPIMNGSWGTVIFLLEVFLLPLCISMSMRIVQNMLAKYFFIQKKHSEDDDDQPLAIDNRRCYHVADYFFFVANVAVGIFSCLLRILKGLLIGLFYLGRLDRCVLMTGWEKIDTGFTAYVGMMELEHAHNHPALRVFCHLLAKSRIKLNSGDESRPSTTESEIARERESAGSGVSRKRYTKRLRNQCTSCDQGESTCCHDNQQPAVFTAFTEKKSGPDDTSGSGTRRHIRQRWFLVYSLLRNPQLIRERRQMPQEGSIAETTNPASADDLLYKHLKATVAAMEMNLQSKRLSPVDLELVDEVIELSAGDLRKGIVADKIPLESRVVAGESRTLQTTTPVVEISISDSSPQVKRRESIELNTVTNKVNPARESSASTVHL